MAATLTCGQINVYAPYQVRRTQSKGTCRLQYQITVQYQQVHLYWYQVQVHAIRACNFGHFSTAIPRSSSIMASLRVTLTYTIRNISVWASVGPFIVGLS